MKRLLTFCCALIILCATTFAHSGRTDSQGGHHSSAEYHFHHGNPAHDHYDINGDGVIDCPYDKDIIKQMQEAEIEETPPTFWDSIGKPLEVIITLCLYYAPWCLLGWLLKLFQKKKKKK